jgi:hypothetical protein
MNADSPVRQNLNVADLHSLFVRGADYAAHQTFFELNWVRRHAKSLVVAPFDGALLPKGDRCDPRFAKGLVTWRLDGCFREAGLASISEPDNFLKTLP